MAEVVAAVITASPRRSRRVSVIAVIAFVILVIIVGACVLAPWISPDDPTALSAHRFAHANGAHLMGTDELGRDLFSRVLYGGRTSLGVAGGATLLATILGAIWGQIAALSRGIVDDILMRLADITMGVPQMLLALIFVAAFGASPVRMAIIVGVLLTPVTARLIRSAALAERNEDYYLAAVAYGAPRWRLILTELLPNLLAPMGVQASINVANGIVLEAALSFVGLGLQNPTISWGLLVQYGFGLLTQSLGYVLFPTLTIFVTIWMLNILADQIGRNTTRSPA